MPQPASAELRALAARTGKAPASWSGTETAAGTLPSRSGKNAALGMVAVKGAVRTPVGQSTAISGPPLDRVALTRQLQRQLQRVGCYGGSISGAWSPSTRRAMKEFTERANATLPIDEPDAILLAMLQNHDQMTCGPGCPAGQSLTGSGRCLPSAIVARDSAKHPSGTYVRAAKLPASTGNLRVVGVRSAATAESTADARQPMAGRMALAGPKLEAEGALPQSGSQVQTARRHVNDRKHAPRLRTRTAASPKYVPSNRRRMGAWIFQDAPVDRLLAR